MFSSIFIVLLIFYNNTIHIYVVLALKLWCYVTVKRFEKFSLNFSISFFVIRVNLLHPCSLMVYYYLFQLLSCLSIFVKYYFQVSFNLTVIFVKLTQKLKKKTWRSSFRFRFSISYCQEPKAGWMRINWIIYQGILPWCVSRFSPLLQHGISYEIISNQSLIGHLMSLVARKLFPCLNQIVENERVLKDTFTDLASQILIMAALYKVFQWYKMWCLRNRNGDERLGGS